MVHTNRYQNAISKKSAPLAIDLQKLSMLRFPHPDGYSISGEQRQT